jgi:hypothetical protein
MKHNRLLSSISSQDYIPCAFYRPTRKPKTPLSRVETPQDREISSKSRNTKSVTTFSR